MNAVWLPVLALAVAAGTSRADQIVLRRADGAAVVVQTSGPQADISSVKLARAINEFDAKSKAQDVFAAVDDDDLHRALSALAATLRDDAVDQLDLADRVAKRTSGGPDDRLLTPGFESMRKLSELISRPPVRLFVHTQITGGVAGTRLWFMILPDYRHGSGEWLPYTPGQSMKIGAYEFRLLGPDDMRPQCQRVEIMADPMVATLDPLECR